MEKKDKNMNLLGPNNFSKNDEKNPKNIDVSKNLEQNRKKIKEELINKKIITSTENK